MIETDRLVLRRWRDDDHAPFAALNADPAVMEHMPAALDRAASDALVRRIEAHFDEHGYGLWAVEVKDGDPFVGFVGLSTVDFAAPFAPAVEIGWRLARGAWGHGYATEGARRALAYAFEQAGLDEVVSFTVPQNARSRAVMVRLGMTHDTSDDFDHPKLPEGHALRRHVLYRMGRAHENGADGPRVGPGISPRPSARFATQKSPPGPRPRARTNFVGTSLGLTPRDRTERGQPSRRWPAPQITRPTASSTIIAANSPSSCTSEIRKSARADSRSRRARRRRAARRKRPPSTSAVTR